MDKPSSPTTWPSAHHCVSFASKKFPHRTKSITGKVCREGQNPSPHPLVMVHVHEFFKVCLTVGCLSRNLARAAIG
ncbi:hypothetical protein HKD37_U058803 [Glycine soja]